MADERDTVWTAEDVYDERISPLMSQIIAICKEHQIPMAATFQFENSEENGPGFCTTILPFPRACEKLVRVANVMRPYLEAVA